MILDTDKLGEMEEWQKLKMWSRGVFVTACSIAVPMAIRLLPWKVKQVFTVEGLAKFTGARKDRLRRHLEELRQQGFIVSLDEDVYLIRSRLGVQPRKATRAGAVEAIRKKMSGGINEIFGARLDDIWAKPPAKGLDNGTEEPE